MNEGFENPVRTVLWSELESFFGGALYNVHSSFLWRIWSPDLVYCTPWYIFSDWLYTRYFLWLALYRILFGFRYTVSVRVEEKQPYRQRTYTWCWAFPPRCSKYKIQIKTIYRTEVRHISNVFQSIFEGLLKLCQV